MQGITRRTLIGAGAALLTGRTALLNAQDRTCRVFVGTFTDPSGQNVPAYFEGNDPGTRSRGLYTFLFDSATGRAGDISLAAEISNPFNLTGHTNKHMLYACRWPTQIAEQNLITAFVVENNALRELNTVRSGGGGPTVGVVDRAGHYLLITNFVTSSIACFRLHRDGSLMSRSTLIDAKSTDGEPSGPHNIVLSMTERFAIVPEIFGNHCRVMRFDKNTGLLETHQLARDLNDAGPRHLVWHPSYRYLYTAGEMGSSISAWRWDENEGALNVIQNLTTRPNGFTGRNTPADIAMHPDGRFVYVTNRGAGTLAGFRIDQSNGSLTLVDQADIGSPSSWSMVFDPSGHWALAAAQIGEEVVMYSVNQQSGRLTQTGQTLSVPSPTSLLCA